MPEKLPILNVRGVVIFPLSEQTLYLGRQASIDAVRKVEESESKRLVVVTQKKAEINDIPDIQDMFAVGTVCRLVKVVKLAESMKILVVGEERVRVNALALSSPVRLAEVEAIEESKQDIIVGKERVESLAGLLQKWRSELGESSALRKLLRTANVQDAARLAASFLGHFPKAEFDEDRYRQEGFQYLFDLNAHPEVNTKTAVRQRLLEELDPETRLAMIETILQGELA